MLSALKPLFKQYCQQVLSLLRKKYPMIFETSNLLSTQFGSGSQFKEVVIEWMSQQSKELKAAGLPILHYYTLGKPKVIKDICKRAF